VSEKWPDLRAYRARSIAAVARLFGTDCAGVVYHANFLKFCERRSDFIRLLGIEAKSLADPPQGEPLVFVVRRVEIDYLKPGRMDDVLEIVTTCAEIGSASLVLQQDAIRDSTLLVRARVTVVLVSKAGKPQRLGAIIRGALQRFVN
jgi:acyl-CoA thioester hydrolase